MVRRAKKRNYVISNLVSLLFLSVWDHILLGKTDDIVVSAKCPETIHVVYHRSRSLRMYTDYSAE